MASVNLFSLMGKIAVDGVEQTTKDLQDVSKEGKSAEGALSTNFTNIANKAGELGKKAAIGLAGVVTAVTALVETTREFRQDLGKLETTFKTTNQETGAAEKTFKTLFGILGEDDTSIEAANHLAMLTNNEKDLNEWTDVLTGVYATFGDSLPLEGLAEAANETMRVGQVTGPLADALNWAGVNEDAFNEKLLECANNQEREALIRETLTGLYGEAAAEYQNVNSSVIENNKAQADLNLKMAETAAKLEPLVTKGKMFLAEVLEKMSPAIEWIIDNINVLGPIVLGLVGALLAMGIVSKIATFINTIKTLQTAFAALNLTMSLNPIGLVIAAVVALIAIFAYLWNNCEEFRNFWINLWENIKNIAMTVWEAIKNAVSTVINTIKSIIENIFNGIKAYFTFVFNFYKTIITTVFNTIKNTINNVINGIKSIIEKIFNGIKIYITTVLNVYKKIFSTVWNGIKTAVSTVVNTIKNVITTVFNTVKNTISNIWNGIKNTISNVINGIKNTISNVFNAIKNNIANIFNGIKNTISNIWNGIIGVIKTPLNWVINGINSFIRGINKIKIPDWVPGVGGRGISIPLIPTLAEGGILEKGEIGLLEGNGAEAVVPLHNNKKWISAVADDMGSIMGIGNNTDVTDKLDRLIGLLTNYLPELSNQQVVLSTGELVGAMAKPMDKALGNLANNRRRGY